MWVSPRWLRITAFAMMGCAPPTAEAVVAPVIFGADDRTELYEVRDDTLRSAIVHAIPALVNQDRVLVDGTTVTLRGEPLGERRDLCAGEAFIEQPSVAFCSGTLIDDDLVLTAGHCVDGTACSDQRYVFGWYYDAAGSMPALNTSMLYMCAEIVAYENSATNDFAIVRLDRAPAGPPLEVRSEPVRYEERLVMAGFPFGIPMKVVENGVVSGILSPDRFLARLDASPGNSGSGVLDADLRLVGELTNGPAAALTVDGDCLRLTVLGDDETIRTEVINAVGPAVGALCASGYRSDRLCADFDGGVMRDAGPPLDAAVASRDFAARCICRVGIGAAVPPTTALTIVALLTTLLLRRQQGRLGNVNAGNAGPGFAKRKP